MSEPLIPERRGRIRDVRIPPNPVPEIEERVRIRVPTEPAIDRLWRSLTGVGVSWFDRDASYLTLTYDLSSEFRNEFKPRETLRIYALRGNEKAVLHATSIRAEGRVLYIGAEFNARLVEWLETGHKSVRIVIERKRDKRWRLRSFVPQRAAPFKSF